MSNLLSACLIVLREGINLNARTDYDHYYDPFCFFKWRDKGKSGMFQSKILRVRLCISALAIM